MHPQMLEDGFARVIEFGKQKIAEAKGELPAELTPTEKFEKELRDSKEDKPKRVTKDKGSDSGK
jgi:hypothetical protein